MKQKLIKSKFLIKELISEDSISFSYLGVDKKTGKRFFIWEFKEEVLDQKNIQKIIRLSEHIMKLKHPNLIPFVDYDYDGGGFYTIFEFSENLMTVNALLTKRPLDSNAIQSISKQLLSLLSYLEENRVAHGSLCLNQLFINKNGEIKVVNPMLYALILQKNLNNLSVMDEGIFYPPEFLQNKPITIQNDIYAFGILLYYLYTKVWPYKYQQKIMALKKQFLKEASPPKRHNKKLSTKFNQIIMACIEKNTANRLNSFKALVSIFKNQTEIDIKTADDIIESEKKIKKELSADIRKIQGHAILRNLKRVAVFLMPVVFLIGLYGLYDMYITEIPMATVPNIVGMQLPEARSVLKKQNLKLKVVGSRIHPVIEKGSIVETKPLADKLVKQTRPIRVFISKGEGQATVPTLLGRTMRQSKLLTDNHNLFLVVSNESFSLTYPRGEIMSQTPTENEEIPIETTVNVTISKGFPVTIKKEKNASFFSDKTQAKVAIKIKVLEEWPTQNIRIINLGEDETIELYSDVVIPGEEPELEFELPVNTTIEVYYEDKLAAKEKI